jgi:hypothetical protein
MAKLLIGQTSEGKQFTVDPSSFTKHIRNKEIERESDSRNDDS